MASAFTPTGALILPHPNFVGQSATDPHIYANDVDGNNTKLTDAAKELYNLTALTKAIGDSGAALALDLSLGTCFTATVSAATTVSFANVPTQGTVVVVLVLTNGGAFTVTWPASVVWAGSKAPTLTAAGKDMLVLATSDGGVSWMGSASLKYGAGA